MEGVTREEMNGGELQQYYGTTRSNRVMAIIAAAAYIMQLETSSENESTARRQDSQTALTLLCTTHQLNWATLKRR